MKIVGRILLTLLIIVVIILVVALFTKKEYTISREITINKPQQTVFEYVKLLRNQDHYAVWNRMDPNMNKTYTGTDGTVGFAYGWDSKNDHVGKGEQTITHVEEGKGIDMGIHFIRPFDARSDAHLTTMPVTGDQTKVTWTFHGKTPYPMNVMHWFMDMDKMLGGDLQKGLDTMKINLEK